MANGQPTKKASKHENSSPSSHIRFGVEVDDKPEKTKPKEKKPKETVKKVEVDTC